MRISQINIRPSFAAILMSIPVVLIVHFRAACLDFTYDECWTFLGYASSDILSVLTNANPAANNHVLHSLAMKLTAALFGTSEYALRIPVLVSMLVFMYFLFKLSLRLHSKWWWLPFFSVLYQPYLLDYFATARGYALALACTSGVIYHLDRLFTKQRSTDAWWAIGFSLLAAYANFTYLLVLCSAMLALVFGYLKDKNGKRFLWPVISGLFVAILMYYAPISRLIEANELYYGGSTGFFTDTLGSLANRTLYNRFGGFYLSVFYAMTLALASGLLLLNLARGTYKQIGFWIAWIMVLTSGGSVAQHYLIGSPYLIDRTALFLLPLLLLSGYWLLFNSRSSPWKYRIGILLAAACMVNTALNLNFSYQLDFKEHADTGKAIRIIQEHAAPEARFHIGKSTYMNATIMFYKRQLDVHQILPAGLEFCDEAGETPYYYLFAKDVDCVDGKDVEFLKRFPVSDTYLYKRRP
ncbi:MAG: hypothetical protein RLP15_08490 [Cryomorphaceae bacterium]